MHQNDQPRPDLDAAIDAVVPALTQVSDETVAASLRRTRIALAEAAPRRAGVGAWRWAAPAVALATVVVAVMLWHPRATVEAPSTRIANARPSAPAAPVSAVAPVPVPSIAVPPRAVRPQPLARAPRVQATSAPRVDDATRPDPLMALVRAVQAIPEDAWRRGTVGVDASVSVDPIVVAPIETPPLPDLTSDPVAPGEP